MNEIKVGNAKIELVQGDITEQETDAIVNAANDQLVLGGGVAGAIRRKGGPTIQQECDTIGGTIVGGAVITGAGKLKARHIIHAVGPRMGEGSEERKLKDATLHSLELMDVHGLVTISFPAISTGIFGYPVSDCARIMIGTTVEYLDSHEPSSIKKVVFCLFDRDTFHVFEQELEKHGLERTTKIS